ncbi:hypothetical protein JL720_6008 [Aureococcus anophagefferens]|nr:hypothetical protein JL720_6008 [Aureococcus anophagefferens]
MKRGAYPTGPEPREAPRYDDAPGGPRRDAYGRPPPPRRPRPAPRGPSIGARARPAAAAAAPRPRALGRRRRATARRRAGPAAARQPARRAAGPRRASGRRRGARRRRRGRAPQRRRRARADDRRPAPIRPYREAAAPPRPPRPPSPRRRRQTAEDGEIVRPAAEPPASDAEAAIGRVERACVGRFLRGKQSKLYFLGVVVRASCPLDEPRRMRFTVDAGGPLPAGDGDAPRFVELAQGQVSNDCVGDAEFAAWRSRALEHLTDEELARPLDAPEAALKPSDLRPLAVPVCGPWVGAAFDAPLDLSKARGRDSPALLLDDAPLRDDLPPAFLDELPFRLDDADDDRRRRKIPKSIVDEICDSDGGSVYEDVDDDDASDDVRAASRAALPEKKPGAKDPPTVVSDESPVSTVRGPHSDSSFLEPPDTPPPPGLGADRRRKRKENLADLENRVRRIGTKVRVARAPGTPRAEVIKIPSGMRTFVLVKMLEGADGGKECLYMPSELILDE